MIMLLCICLMTLDGEHLVTCLLAVSRSSLVKCVFRSLGYNFSYSFK